jgi:hypothetical protein
MDDERSYDRATVEEGEPRQRVSVATPASSNG